MLTPHKQPHVALIYKNTRPYNTLFDYLLKLTCTYTYTFQTGNGSLSGKLNYLRNAKDRLLFILNFIRSATGIMNYDVYLKSMMLLDMHFLTHLLPYNYGNEIDCDSA